MVLRPSVAAAWAGALVVVIGGGWRSAHAATQPATSTYGGVVHQRIVLGRSTGGREIVAIRRGNPASPHRLLVVGSIHGNESAGVDIARRLARMPAPTDLDVWIVATLNPDGIARGTRQNGRGVDLNRNFPYGWRRLDRLGGLHYSGERALSEPESRVAWRLINRVHPRVTIWFHQALGVVDLSGGRPEVEWRYGRLVGLPVRRLPRYPGSVTTWQNHAFPGSTAFVVELGRGRLSPAQAHRFAAAAIAVAGTPRPRRRPAPPLSTPRGRA